MYVAARLVFIFVLVLRRAGLSKERFQNIGFSVFVGGEGVMGLGFGFQGFGV